MLKPIKAYGVDDCRRYYESEWGDLIVEVSTITHQHASGSLMTLWVKHGWVERFVPCTLSVKTYYHDEEGNCWGIYNPQIKTGANDDGLPRAEINFEWVLEATEENEQKLLNEIERRYDEFYC